MRYFLLFPHPYKHTPLNPRYAQAQEVYSEVIGTIRNHLDGISNYFRNRTTSGAMEGINNRIKLIKRQAYGFVNFNNFRERLLACFSD
jgi:transposase